MFNPTSRASTAIVPTSVANFKCTVYMIGGKDDNYEEHTKIMKIELFDIVVLRPFWLLHLLKTTGFTNCISLNLCDDLI